MKSPILSISGIIKGIAPPKKITDNYSIQELYLIFDESYEKGGERVEKESTPKFQFSGKDLAALAKLQAGDHVNFSFKIVGRKYEKDGKKGHITSIEAWGIKKLVTLVESGSVVPDADVVDDPDDLPF